MRRVSIPVSRSSSAITGPQRVAVKRGRHAAPCRAARTGRLWAWLPESSPTPCSRTRIAHGLCRCTRPPGMQRIDLGTALAVVLEAHPHRQGEQIGKALDLPLALVFRGLARLWRLEGRLPASAALGEAQLVPYVRGGT